MRRARACLAAALLLAAGCRRHGETDGERAPAPAPTPTPEPSVVVHPAAEAASDHPIVVRHGSELAGLDLSGVTSLDLAMSPIDHVGHLADLDAETTCDAVDLVALAERAPALTQLRISGCQSAIHAGLSAFGPRLHALTLADVTLDGVTIGNLQALSGLQELTLSRVELGTDRLERLRTLALRRVVLHALAKNSELSQILDLWPRTLKSVVLEGSWAGHNAMLTLSRADALESLELRGTSVGNFSLNQIKPLEHLRELVLEGSTFNDHSPLYMRELPVERFVCNCPRLGDGGLRSLRHSEGIRELELRETQVTGEGLAILQDLGKLERLVLLDRDIGAPGFAALASLGNLRQLELSGEVEDPKLPGLGKLSGLKRLWLRKPGLDDRVTAELASLQQLEVLVLRDTRVSDVGLADLGKLGNLVELDLGGTRVTNRGLTHLRGLTRLRELSLDHTDVVDGGLAGLAGHPALTQLRLDRTLVTDACIDTLLSMPALERLSLAHTVVTRAAVARLRDHPALTAIDIEGLR